MGVGWHTVFSSDPLTKGQLETQVSLGERGVNGKHLIFIFFKSREYFHIATESKHKCGMRNMSFLFAFTKCGLTRFLRCFQI